MILGIGKTPFLRLLIPVIVGIVVCSYFPEFSLISKHISVILGLLLILISLFLKNDYRFKYRWLFGAGLFLFTFSLSQTQYHRQEQSTQFNFSENEQYFIGTITDIPKVKPRTIACNVKLNNLDGKRKNVVLYIQQTDEAWSIEPGDEILFLARIEPFKNLGNPDDFDYARYMKQKGYSGTAYIESTAWRKTGNKSISITSVAQRFRIKALEFYKIFELDSDAYAFISALTLGYKEDLTDSMQEAFRASGTAHVLAVSGLHVGIIYIIINLIFSFLGRNSEYSSLYIIKQLLIIVVLWAYVFLAGMSASVVRAAIMLTINCVANMLNQRGFTYNTLAAAAFFILIYSPFYLFDVSFQMSFGAVFAILFFLPKFKTLYTPSNKVSEYIYNLFTISLSAQLGVFPLVLYYFGTFPTYFFITNLLVVPLVVLIIYAIVPLILINLLPFINVWAIDFFNYIFQWLVKSIAEITLRVVYIAETLPFAQVTNLHITAAQLILLLLFIFIASHWLFVGQPKSLLAALSALLLFLLTSTYSIVTKASPQLVVFNSNNKSEIAIFYENRRRPIELPENGFIPFSEKTILRLSDNTFATYQSENRFKLDILIISGNISYSIAQLMKIFNPNIIVLDSSMPDYHSTSIINDCNSLDITVHDVKRDGAFLLNY